MERKALDAAWEEYAIAADCLDKIVTSSEFNAYKDAWGSFVAAHLRVFERLKRVHWPDESGRAWCESKLNQQYYDPLLRYLFHARNESEHSIEPIVERRTVNVKRPQVNTRLVDVIVDKRKGVGLLYEVPQTHLGKPITNQSPMGIATLALVYLASVLAEADEFVRRPVLDISSTPFAVTKKNPGS